MNNYNEMIGETCRTDAGEYTIEALVHDDGCTDQSINLYVGRAADGHHDLIASDNASMWVVGNEDDAALNHDHWAAIAKRCDVASVLAEVRNVDADLADWLRERYHEAWEMVAPLRKATSDEQQRLIDANYAEYDVVDAEVIAETENGAKLYRICRNQYAIEGETGEIIADLDGEEAARNWGHVPENHN